MAFGRLEQVHMAASKAWVAAGIGGTGQGTARNRHLAFEENGLSCILGFDITRLMSTMDARILMLEARWHVHEP